MNKNSTLILVSFFCLFANQALAKKTIESSLNFSSTESKENYCSSRNSSAAVKERFINPDERMGFDNGLYGLANKGICWWHTRFQRNSLYLANFEPSSPKPSPQEAKKIIRAIRAGKNVVSVPGYANLKEFSLDYKDEIIRQLENWQIVDSVVNQRWIQGMSGKSSSASDMKTQMDLMYEKVAIKKQLTYAKVQVPGITAHAMLVGDIQKTEDGYTIQVIDSNKAGETQTYQYKNGDDSLKMDPGIVGDVDSFVPYVEFTNEVDRMEKIIDSTCGGYDKESDTPLCGQANTINENDYSSNYIFNPESMGLDLPTFGEETGPPQGGAAECTSRSVNPKYDKFDGEYSDKTGLPMPSGISQ